jgi:multidrug efflux pump subunit AcrB
MFYTTNATKDMIKQFAIVIAFAMVASILIVIFVPILMKIGNFFYNLMNL